MVRETFERVPQGWPDTPDGPASYFDGTYRLAPKEGLFDAIDAPGPASVGDVVLSGRFSANAHGNPAQRAAFLLGLQASGGFSACAAASP